ncbi:Glutaredoxin [Salinibacillus kushneri]|uniref:Glutaredoxin n=1 Tax=Salinibacillus kushneri TaxID=237682 RepID=A0A1I0BHR9_9BACI|nr:glutaredoxin family protein [Salinibacillus kushneri]SET06090.1 Glutaredoxin [Salinibacillus kushneri]
MRQNEVLVYTSDNCEQSQNVMQLLNQWDVPFQEKNISKHPPYLKELQADKVYATPVTYVRDERILGYQKGKLERLIGRS